jgi:hypothetical protein|tara:strand:+ start:83 stop:226 length:144 start_codon:yes stop_codon:yes gene_type:complete
MKDEVIVYDDVNKLDICLSKRGKLYLIKDGKKMRINTIKVIENREVN